MSSFAEDAARVAKLRLHIANFPKTPGVYLMKDAKGRMLYVGKAKDLRRRLTSYRNATRRKAHRKMRTLVRTAAALEVRPQETETKALLLENEIIRTLRPPYNIDGAFSFLYPALGVGQHDGRVLLAFTSTPEEWDELDVRWHGAFRSRRRARAAFDALVALFARVGHAEPPSRRPVVKLRRGVHLAAFRRVPEGLAAAADAFLAGESTDLLTMLFDRLLESSRARHEAAEVTEELRTLRTFVCTDVVPLQNVLRATNRTDYVAGHERDALFIAARNG